MFHFVDAGLQTLSQEQIEAIVNSETNPKLRRELSNVLSILNLIMEIGIRRNKVIVRNVMSRHGDYAILMGSGHVEGLRDLIRDICLSKSPKFRQTLSINPSLGFNIHQRLKIEASQSGVQN